MATYKGILTNNGKALLASATVANPVNYSHLAVGDGNGSTPTPLETRSALVNEKARIALNVVEINPNQTNQIICEAIIPTNIGGFHIREFGLFAGSVMIVNGNYPLTYKPAVNEGGAREIAIKVIINVQNAEVIALYLDDSLIYATREWVKNNYIPRADIIDNLTTNDANKPVSAKQAKLLQDNKAEKTTTITAGTGLNGGGDLSASRTLSVNYGTTAGTAAQGNDSRLSDAREWTAETVSQAEAEAGTATTRRAWTAQRVGQAAASSFTTSFNTVTTPFTRTMLSRTTATQARSDLGLGTAATATLTTSQLNTAIGSVLRVGDFGIGARTAGWGTYPSMPSPATSTAGNNELPTGFYLDQGYYAIQIKSGGTGTFARLVLPSGYSDAVSQPTFVIRTQLYGTYTYTLWNSRNTTVDSNGFIKKASPIAQLFADKIELNDEAQLQNIEFEKLGTGDYVIKNSTGFSKEGWYIEQPKDANGNIYHAVIHQQLENGDISVKTFEQKLEGTRIVADVEKPVDIKENRFISIRLNELPKDTTAPQNPNIVDSEGNPAPSKFHYLENGTWKITTEDEVTLENERYAAYQASLKHLTRRQFKLALLENNLLDTIESAINAIEDSHTRTKLQIEYQEATEFHRLSESVIYMCSLLGLSDEQVDTMWEAALLF